MFVTTWKGFIISHMVSKCKFKILIMECNEKNEFKIKSKRWSTLINKMCV
jgi:hypothetical protein